MNIQFYSKQQNQNSFIKYQNHKIIFVSNNRGNITLLNNVLNAKFISNHKGIIGVFLRIEVGELL